MTERAEPDCRVGPMRRRRRDIDLSAAYLLRCSAKNSIVRSLATSAAAAS